MKNTLLGLEEILGDIQLEDIKKLCLEIKDKAILNPGEDSIIEEGENENELKWNTVRSKEVKNEMKLKTIDNQLKEKLKKENKEIEKEKNKEKIYIKKEYKLKDELKLNKEFPINSINNSSNDELNHIEDYIVNLLFLIISFCCPKRREEKRREEKRRYLLFRGRRRE